MKLRYNFWIVLFLSSQIFVASTLWAANSSLDFNTGLNNFFQVTKLIQDKFDAETDQAELYKKAWISLERVLPATDIIASGTIVSSSSKAIRNFYANRITETLEKTASIRPDDATPTIRELWNKVTQGLVWSLKDPYSQYLPTEENKELQRVLSGVPDKEKQFYGVGISVEWDNEKDEGVLVISPLPGAPADRSGIRAGDVIVAVSTEFFKDWDGPGIDKLTKAIELIKGEEGTEVLLKIKRSGSAELLEFTLKREPINPDLQIRKEMLDDEIGYVRLYSFNAHACDDVLEALRYLKTEGMKKLIFDLRTNPGGYLDQAVKVADLFLKKDELITYTLGRSSKPHYFHKSKYVGKDDYSGVEMVILMNEYSASASEVVTGALKDNQRAFIIGKKSFGKGSVQEVFALNQGAGLRLTVAKYYTPSNICIHGIGIQPDIEVDHITEEEWNAIKEKDYHNVPRLQVVTERDPQLKVAMQYLQGEISLADTQDKAKSKKDI